MANKDIPELTKDEFDKFAAEGKTVIDFYADWCMPCLIMSPYFEEMAERFQKHFKFGRVNVDDNEHLSEKFRVMSIPTIVVLKDGKEIERFVGSMHPEEFENSLKKHI